MVVVVLVIFYLMAGFMTACMVKVLTDRNPSYDTPPPEQMASITLFWPLWIVMTPFFVLTWFFKKIF